MSLLTVPTALKKLQQSKENHFMEYIPLPEDVTLPLAVVVRDIGEHRAAVGAFRRWGGYVALDEKRRGSISAEKRFIALEERVYIFKQPEVSYEITDSLAIEALHRFGQDGPFEHPRLEMDRQLAAQMIAEAMQHNDAVPTEHAGAEAVGVEEMPSSETLQQELHDPLDDYLFKRAHDGSFVLASARNPHL